MLLVDGLLEHNLLELLVHRLAAFDELVGEEEAAVGHGLSIVENLVDVKPEVAEMLVEKTKVRSGRGSGEGKEVAFWMPVPPGSKDAGALWHHKAAHAGPSVRRTPKAAQA